MFSRPYTTLSRITIEAADCKMNYQHLNGHLMIYVEPIDPVFPTGNRDPLLTQTIRQNTINNTTTKDPQPSTSNAHQHAMTADSTHRSPPIPTQFVEPLQLQPSNIPSAALSPIPATYDEANYPQQVDSDTNSEDEEQNTAPTSIPDPVHMPNQDNEMQPQEDIPQNENQNERPHTPDPDNPMPDNTEFANSNFPINELPGETPTVQPQPSTSNSNANSALANFMESANFQETMKKMTVQVGETTFNRIAKNPKLVKQWILQVVHRFPGLLDDLTDDTVEFMDRNTGPIRILQPNTSQPLDQQDHETSQVKQEAPPITLSLQQQEENNDAPTIPSSTSPAVLSDSNSDSDSDDCVIEKISPCPKRIPLKRAAPPPDGSAPQVILKKIPHKQGTGSYTVTTTPDIHADIHGQTSTQTNTGLDQDRTPKRPRLQDQTQPSTSTGAATNTTHNNNRDKKQKKHRKDKKKDKDKDK